MSLIYTAPLYMGISCLLSLSYGSIEYVKDKGNLNFSSKSILFCWCILSIIVTSIIAGATGEMMSGKTNITHLLIASILACVTLIISSCMVYWT